MASRGSNAATFSGQLTPLAQKRISKERQKIEQERAELETCGIFFVWGDELHRAMALIVGPEDTPYERGFYFFDIQIADNYPLQPPNVDFRTGDGRVRFNPNLYVEGKSLLNEHPIQNEPGHDGETGKNDRLYSEIIGYENIAVGVARMFKRTPEKFSVFRPQMRKIFLKNYDAYLKKLEAYKAKDGTSVRSPIWNFQVRYKTEDLLAELADLRTVLQKEEDELEQEGSAAASGTAADAAAPAPAAAVAAAPEGDKRGSEAEIPDAKRHKPEQSQ